MPFRLELLGRPRLVVADRPAELPVTQPLLFAAYLAHRDDWIGRGALAGTFWPDASEKSARNNLRQLLYTVRGLPWGAGVETEHARVRWRGASDLTAFRECLGQGRWAEALEHYRGSFLEGVDTPAAAAVESWLADARHDLHASWRDAALTHARTRMEAGAPEEAADLLERVLERDDLAEDALQAYLACALRSGRRRRGLELYERFARALRAELDIDPLDETIRLARALREASRAPAGDAPAPGFPAETGAFVGRDLELVDLGNLLRRRDVRLVTLLGVGGIGKTRLAARLGRELAASFRDGAVFVPLAPVATPEGVVPALAAALGLRAGSERSAREQLAAHLRERELLLVLDNFEHLLGAAELVNDLVAASPASRLLVTSRVALGLGSETLYDVGGLETPAADDATVESFGAVKLFLHCARRMQIAFAPDDAARRDVARICRLVEGSALAIELAASWLRVMSLGEIAAELERGLDLLESQRRDLPARHRSMRAVFDHSWDLLSPGDRAALADLSVFRGGFDRDGARAVAGVSVATLLRLVNSSQLRRTPAGRFERHVLARQYGAERLAADPERRTRLQRAHGEHYARLAETAAASGSGEEAAWLERLRSEHANLGAALERGIARADAETCLRLGAALAHYWRTQGLAAEALAPLERAVALAGAADHPELLARTRNTLAVLHGERSDWKTARAHLDASLAIARTIDAPATLAETLNRLGTAAQMQRQVDAARRFFEEGLRLRRRLGDALGIAKELHNLGSLARSEGDAERARPYFEEALTAFRRLGSTIGAAYAITGLGAVAFTTGRLDEAEARYREALPLLEGIRFSAGVAMLLHALGTVHLAQDRPDAAYDALARSLAIDRDLGHREGIVEALEYFAALAVVRGGEDDLARALLAAAARLRREHDLPVEPDYERGLRPYLERIPAGPAPPPEAVEETDALLERALARLAPTPAAAARARQRSAER